MKNKKLYTVDDLKNIFGKWIKTLENKDIAVFGQQLNRLFEDTVAVPCIFRGPNCSGDVIRSHTIQNAVMLDKFVQDGHVVMLKPGQKVVDFARVSRHKATTFSGMCNYHDTQIFKPIDLKQNEELDLSNPMTLELLAFRAFCKEYFEKCNQAQLMEKLSEVFKKRDLVTLNKMAPFTKKFGENIPWAAFKDEVFKLSAIGAYMALIDIEDIFDELKKSVIKGKPKLVNNIVRLSGVADIAASSIATPNKFFDNSLTVNNPQADMEEKLDSNLKESKRFKISLRTIAFRAKSDPWKVCFINVFPHGGETVFLLSYRDEDKAFFDQFIAELSKFDDANKKLHITRFLISNIGNIVFKPDYVENLTDPVKEQIKKDFGDSVPGDLNYENLILNIFK